MNKLTFLVVGLLVAFNINAQTTTSSLFKKSSYAAPSRDYVMIQFGYNGWNNVPDSIKIGGLGRALNVYLCYEFPIQKSHFSFAAGVGISSSNIYLKNQQIVLADTGVGSIRFIPEVVNYKKYKYNITYVEAPFELRFFEDKKNKNVGIKAAIGLKIGAVISAHTKGKETVNSKPILEKESTKRYLEAWRYSPTLRIGWGNFSVYGQYTLSNMFKTGTGPTTIKPFQIGICISGL